MTEVVDQVQLNLSTDNVWVLNVCIGIVMFGVALELKKSDFLRIVNEPSKVLFGLLSQFIAFPLITYLMVLLFEPSASVALGMFLVAACPGGNVSNFMTSLGKGNVALSVSLTALSTTGSVFMTPLSFAFWGNLYGPSSLIIKEISLRFQDIFGAIFLTLIVPLILGMLFSYYLPKVTKLVSGKIKIISLLIFGMFIVGAFANNWQQFLDYIQYVIGIVIIHNGIAFITGNLIGRLGKLDLADVKTLTIETGIQNSGLALLLIFNFFEGYGGMALVAACWGVWDLISGVAVGYFLSRFK